MRIGKKILSFLLTVIMVIVNMTSAFAFYNGHGTTGGHGPGGDIQDTAGSYSHMAIAVKTINDEGYELAGKPEVYVGDTRIELNEKQNSENNGYEYQTDFNKYSFTKNTVFTVKAVLTKDNINKFNVEFEIKDFCNDEDEEGNGRYKVVIGSEVKYYDSFYEYCRLVNCDNHTGIDMKLTYQEIIENFYDVKYDVDGDYTVVTDTANYEAGDTVTIKEGPSKEGYKFSGWQYGDEVYQAGETIIMPEENVTFTAVWTKLYTVTYKVDGEVVYTKVVDEGTDISDSYKEYKYDMEDDSKNLSDWEVETTDANLKSLDKDVVIVATTSDKTFTVTYIVDGEEYETLSNVAYGTELDVDSVVYNNPSKIFSGWTVESGDASNVKSDVIIVGTTQDKYFSVTYIVDDEVVEIFENVLYGDKAPSYDYEPEEGYDFSGWTVKSGDTEKVTSDVVLTGTTSIKSFTVTFVDENDNVISEETYTYGSQAEQTAAPEKDDYKFIDETGAARWFKYSFAGWVAEGEYILEDLNSVKQNMTFKASYKENEINTMFYVLNRGLSQPDELSSYPKKNYSYGVAGTISDFTEVANDDAVVKANIVSEPSAGEFKLKDGSMLELNEGEYIKWYVIKEEADGWHVDGIIVGQKYNVTVNYVDTDTNEEIADSRIETVAATEGYEITSPEVKGYELVNADDAVIEGIMTYDDVEVTVMYKKIKYTLTINYVDTEGNKVADSFEKKLVEKAGYEIESPVVDGYKLSDESQKTVKGEMPSEDIVVTVVYSKLEPEPTTEEPTTEEPTTEEPTTEEPTTEEPTTEEPTTEEPTTEEPTTEEPTTEEPTTEEPTTEEPTTEEPTTEEPTTEEPTTEEPTTEEPTTEKPTTEEPTTEESTTEKPTTEEPTTEEPTTEEPTTEEPTTEEIIELPTEDIPLSDGSDIEKSSEEPSGDADSSDDDRKPNDDVKKNDDANKPDDEEIVDLADEDIPLSDGTPKTADTVRNAGIIASMFAAVMAAVAVAFGKKKNK